MTTIEETTAIKAEIPANIVSMVLEPFVALFCTGSGSLSML